LGGAGPGFLRRPLGCARRERFRFRHDRVVHGASIEARQDPARLLRHDRPFDVLAGEAPDGIHRIEERERHEFVSLRDLPAQEVSAAVTLDTVNPRQDLAEQETLILLRILAVRHSVPESGDHGSSTSRKRGMSAYSEPFEPAEGDFLGPIPGSAAGHEAYVAAPPCRLEGHRAGDGGSRAGEAENAGRKKGIVFRGETESGRRDAVEEVQGARAGIVVISPGEAVQGTRGRLVEVAEGPRARDTLQVDSRGGFGKTPRNVNSLHPERLEEAADVETAESRL